MRASRFGKKCALTSWKICGIMMVLVAQQGADYPTTEHGETWAGG